MLISNVVDSDRAKGKLLEAHTYPWDISLTDTGPRSFLIFELAKRGSHGFKHLLIAGKSNPTLLRDELVADPHGKLPGFAASRFHLYTELFLKQRRHTGSARRVRRS